MSNRRRPSSTAHVDQLAAARRDTATLHGRLSARLRNRCLSQPGTHVGDRIEEWFDVLRAGCPHVYSPCAVVGLIARPGVFYCRGCVVGVLLDHVERHPDRCDGCARRSGIFRSAAVLAGPYLTLLGDLCSRCHAENHGAR